MLEIKNKKLRKELVEARQRLDRDPDRLSRVEIVARILHWLGDREAEELFASAASQLHEGINAAKVRGRDIDARMMLTLANYYRLAGDRRQAREWFERAYEAVGEVPSGGGPEFTYKTDSGYLLGKYEEVVALGELWGNERAAAVALS